MAKLAPSISLYAYCYNNPINYIDRFGLFGEEPTYGPYQLDEIVVYGKGSFRALRDEMLFFLNMLNDAVNRTAKEFGDGKDNSSHEAAMKAYAKEFAESLKRMHREYDMINAGLTLGSYGVSHSSTTFRLIDSKGKLDLKYYKSGWKGNQYVTPIKVSTLGKFGGTAMGLINIGLASKTLLNPQASTFDKSLAAGDVAFGSAGIVGGVIGGTAGATLSWISLGYGVVAIPLFLGTYYNSAPIIHDKQSSGLYFPHPYVGK